MQPELPSSDERTVVIGATGSGKTQGACWLLSTRDFYKRPGFILDFKGEKLFTKMALTPFNLGEPLPYEPGLYWIRFNFGMQSDEDLTKFFMDIYYHENCGLLIDETMMAPPNDRWLKALLTQGRSKNIEMILCTQRPARIDLSILTEASYLWIFRLGLKDDRKRVSEIMDGLTINRLPRYHSLWYDVAEQEYVVFEPVPDADTIVKTFTDFDEEKEEIIEQYNEPGIITL